MEALRIFLLLPDGEICDRVRASLNSPEFDCAWCRSVSDALIVLIHGKFDLLVSQAALPAGSGLDVLGALDEEGIEIPSLMFLGPEDASLSRNWTGQFCDFLPLSEDFAANLPGRARNAVAKHRLEQANRIYIAALESARDGIMITDLQGVVLHVNRALESLTGFSRDELVGRPSQILCASAPNSDLHERLWLAIKQRASWQGELAERRKDGSWFDVSLTVSPILDSRGRLTHCVAIERDITSRKVMENRLVHAQKMQSLGTLAGGVAHEFNNLLTGILGYAGLALTQGDEQEARKEFIQEIVSLAERAAGLTKQMLAYARKSPMNRQALPVVSLVRQTAELVERTLHQRLELENFEAAAAWCINADANQLEQVLINLILNARDALEDEKAVAVGIQQEKLSASRTGFPDNVPPGDYVVLEVRDTGHGMTPEVLSRAVDPFFTTRPVGKGTGMGLSVVLGIVHNHHGFLTIESRAGEGTSVRVYLPRLEEVVQEAAPPDSFIEPEPISPARILVHDDEAAVLEVVRRYLEDAGHHVVCASDESEVLNLARQASVLDMAILDQFPQGPIVGTLAGRLLELRPRLPILFCPGRPPDDQDAEHAEKQRVLWKPFRMNELGFAVQELLGSQADGLTQIAPG
jgi:PAS domain S-box-containing protein